MDCKCEGRADDASFRIDKLDSWLACLHNPEPHSSSTSIVNALTQSCYQRSAAQGMILRLRIWQTLPRVRLRTRQYALRATNDSVTEEDLAEARKFMAQFTEDQIPRRFCDVNFSRSSGPGGQNVNKYVAWLSALEMCTRSTF